MTTIGRVQVRRWPADGPARLVVLVHGYGEHIGRYEHVAWALLGRAAEAPSSPGQVGSSDGVDHAQLGPVGSQPVEKGATGNRWAGARRQQRQPGAQPPARHVTKDGAERRDAHPTGRPAIAWSRAHLAPTSGLAATVSSKSDGNWATMPIASSSASCKMCR